MADKKYPIYHFDFVWDQDDFKNNGTGYEKMFKEQPTEQELKDELERVKAQKVKKQIESGHPISKWNKAEYVSIGYDTWCSGWFDHMTYNKFESDIDALASFEEYVNRHEGNSNDCLMGAEDRWRWAVCHCDGCKQNNWTIINH